MSDSLGHPLTIITFAPLDLLVSFFFNKSTTAVANIEPTPSMASISAESQSSGSTINLSPTELQDIIAQAVLWLVMHLFPLLFMFYPVSLKLGFLILPIAIT